MDSKKNVSLNSKWINDIIQYHNYQWMHMLYEICLLINQVETRKCSITTRKISIFNFQTIDLKPIIALHKNIFIAIEKYVYHF